MSLIPSWLDSDLGGTRISSYASAFYQNVHYFFGGYDGKAAATNIVSFDESSQLWSISGQLITGRSGHSVIFTGNAFLVVGGSKDGLKTEKCVPNETHINCTELESTFDSYGFFPEITIVNNEFSSNCL